MIPSLAWKNIWRNRSRSLVIVLAIVIGILGGTFAAAFMMGLIEERIDSVINLETGDIQIHHPLFPENEEIQYDLPDAETMRDTLLKTQGVSEVSCRTKIPGLVLSANTSVFAEIAGIEPGEEKQVTRIWHQIPDSCGNYFSGTGKNQVLVGKKLTEKLHVQLNSRIVLRFQDSGGNIIEAAFKICGIYNTHNDLFDQKMVFIKSSDLSRILGYPAPVHEIVIDIKNLKEISAIKSVIRKRYPGLLVRSWDEIMPEIGVLVDATSQLTYIFLAIILLALAFGLLNTMLMSVFERKQELGMLMSVGMNRSRVFGMILFETIMLALTGGSVGMIVSAGIISISHRVGINLAVVGKGLESIGYKPIVYPSIPGDYFLILSVMIVITGILSALYPAWKALQISPAEAQQ